MRDKKQFATHTNILIINNQEQMINSVDRAFLWGYSVQMENITPIQKHRIQRRS